MIEPARVSARRAPRPGLVVFGQPRYDGGRRQLTGRGKNMSTASAKLMTAEEFYDFCHRPENRDRHFELDQGEVVEEDEELTGGDELPEFRCRVAEFFQMPGE